MQQETTILIKGMVCQRCVMVVRDELSSSGYTPLQVELGKATVGTPEKELNTDALQERLAPLGFSLLVNRNRKLVGDVKALIKKVYSGDYDFPEGFRFSKLLGETLQQPYESISDVFIATEGNTIEQCLILFRINKIKEYLVYTTHTLADIAFKLNFSSVAHLSAHFKQHTGLTPSYFRKLKNEKTAVMQSADSGAKENPNGL